MSTQDATTKKREGRSPSYPDFGLEEAITKARKLWAEEKRSFTPIPTIQGHWNYKPNTGPGIRAIAALKSYGLLTEQGRGPDRKAKLSDLAYRIIIDDRPDSKELQDTIREAALTPPVIREIWEEFEGNLPSDANLKFTLRSRGFSESGANNFIDVLRKTVAFAKLHESDIITEEEEGQPEGEIEEKPEGQSDPFLLQNPFGESKVMQNPKVHEEDREGTDRKEHIFEVPIGRGEWVALKIPGMLSETEWRQLFVVLTAMKPGLVKESPIKPEDVPKEIEETLRSMGNGGKPKGA